MWVLLTSFFLFCQQQICQKKYAAQPQRHIAFSLTGANRNRTFYVQIV